MHNPAAIHASTVAVAAADGWRGLLILGAAGAGKSSTALALMALGARLVADDRTLLSCRGGALFASCPPQIAGQVEARGLGILAAEPLEHAQIFLALDLGIAQTTRLPEQRHREFIGVSIPLVGRTDNAHFCAMILQYLKAGRLA